MQSALRPSALFSLPGNAFAFASATLPSLVIPKKWLQPCEESAPLQHCESRDLPLRSPFAFVVMNCYSQIPSST